MPQMGGKNGKGGMGMKDGPMGGKNGKGGMGMKDGPMGGKDGHMGMNGCGGPGMMNNLTDEEKTKLESMTDEQKKTFFETKRTEMDKKRESHQAVIDKLIDGKTLSDADKTVLEEIKKQRAEAQAQKTKMDEMKTLMDKVKDGGTLTTEEQKKVDEFKSNMPETCGMGKGFGAKSFK